MKSNPEKLLEEDLYKYNIILSILDPKNKLDYLRMCKLEENTRASLHRVKESGGSPDLEKTLEKDLKSLTLITDILNPENKSDYWQIVALKEQTEVSLYQTKYFAKKHEGSQKTDTSVKTISNF